VVLAGARNIISGNGNFGVFIGGSISSTGNKVEGNFIGTTADGNAALSNREGGVLIVGASSNSIGGRPGQRAIASPTTEAMGYSSLAARATAFSPTRSSLTPASG
jgi:hypothetical protein